MTGTSRPQGRRLRKARSTRKVSAAELAVKGYTGLPSTPKLRPSRSSCCDSDVSERSDWQARQMTTHNPLAKETGNSLAGWLICNGFLDQNAAYAASRSLDVPCLEPLWNVLQRKVRSRAGRANLPAYTAETARNPCDQKEEKLTKLTEQVQSVLRQLYVAQVRNI